MEPEDLHPDDLIGVTRLASKWRLFAGTIAEWILDYESYDPGFGATEGSSAFRSGLVRVSEENADAFHEAMVSYELTGQALQAHFKRVGISEWPLQFVVDFDERIYISSFSEVPSSEYLPDGWVSKENPMAYVPAEIKRIWQPPSQPPSQPS